MSDNNASAEDTTIEQLPVQPTNSKTNIQTSNDTNNTVAIVQQEGNAVVTPTPQPAAAGAPVPAAPRRQSGWEIIKTVLFRMLMIYFVTRFFRRTPQNPVTNSTLTPSFDGSGAFTPGNIFPKGSKLDMYIYITEDQVYSFNQTKEPFWLLENLEYGNWKAGPNRDGTFTKYGQIPISETVQNNGSLYLHVFVTEHGYSPNPEDGDSYSKRYSFSKTKRLNKFKKKVYKKTKNLLTGNTEHDEEYQKKADDKIVELLSHWHPNMTINLLDDHSPWTKGSIPPPLDQYIEFDMLTGKYYPVLYLNDYWNLLSDYYPINNTMDTLNLTLVYSPLQLWKWQMYISQSLRQSWYGNLLGDDESDEDQDAMKRALIETNPYLLIITICVSIVHTVFEILAFKNDIQFWRTRKSLEGLSVRSIFFNIFQSAIVLLYVFDNDTNTMVRISVFVGILIELWKIPKILTFARVPNETWFGLIPKFKYIYKPSYTDTSTSDYDQKAFRYLSWALFPLVIGYAIYSLTYHEHKSWYSFVLSTIYGFLLTFGFIMMTPQLFINYKLKSVAHLPWRMMTYKALNTFIDDMFAFVIKMPTMYRIGCFRDDIIFFIYLYQRYIYPVDRRRTNEFGTSGENETGAPNLQQLEQGHSDLQQQPPSDSPSDVDSEYIIVPSPSSSQEVETLRHRKVSKSDEQTTNSDDEHQQTTDLNHTTDNNIVEDQHRKTD